MPYTDNFIFVGVGYDRVPPAERKAAQAASEHYASAFELLAIPHEVGHYVYEHGKFADGTAVKALSEQFSDNTYFRWCEEMFADLYGCLVAGPLVAFSLQAMLMSTDKKRVMKDDAHHPAPMLRPYVLSEILRVLSRLAWGKLDDDSSQNDVNQRITKTTQMLNDIWTVTLHNWGYARVPVSEDDDSIRIYLPDHSTPHLETIVNVERVLSTVRPIIEIFAQHLIDSLAITTNDDDTSSNIPWFQSQHIRKNAYYQGMEALIKRLAQEEAGGHALLNLDVVHPAPNSSNPDEQLASLIEDWKFEGPLMIGGH